ncbi:MAG: hypothetical protein ABI352_04980 [Candidatus Dormibacter sp.]
MKTVVAFIVAIIGGLIFLTAGTIGWSVGRGAVSATAATRPAVATGHLNLTVATPAMLGTEIGPALLPSAITVPANTEVTVTVANFDGATPLTGVDEKYAKATGIKGSLSCSTLDPTNPNGAPTTAAQTSTSVDPSLVSHTFTVAALGLNVPVCAMCKTSFTFFSGAPGHFTWRCMDPCGPGASGWGGAMATTGYMSGELTVV